VDLDTQGSNTSCPYFPCSKYGTNCKYCFCIFYPCREEKTGGKYILAQNGYKIWDCTDCKYIHQDAIVEKIKLDINETDPHKLKIAWNVIRRRLNVNTFDY
jgi:Zn-finger protein